MAELDYAFLADYAAVEGGKLNVLGASFTQIHTAAVPAQQQLYIAGRIRGSIATPVAQLKISITPPDETFQLDGVLDITSEGQEPYFEDKVGILFAVGLQIPLTSSGLYTVRIGLDEVESRILKFTVQVGE